MNKLHYEKSPYLLQHATNPVDWYPWGEEAFEKARAEDKAIFLSIGYSTCHWCHVMAHESFEDEDVAEIVNRHFVAIKVDREERPDIDAIYMTACQALTGQGGWPLSIFMTPSQKPFFAGTYFPKDDYSGRPGFISLLKLIASKYQSDRSEILKAGEAVTEALNRQMSGKTSLEEGLLEEAYEEFKRGFDTQYGGFSASPKFPSPHQLMYLLRYSRLKKDAKALKMVTATLNAMSTGGIRDHIGGGFSRYSVDEKWLVPHFEKMLYDQAMLMLAYTEAWQVTKNSRYQEVVEEIAAYVKEALRSKEGGFYSAEDADSEGEEGRFYIWTGEEIDQLLGSEAAIFKSAYGFDQGPNFEGRNILNTIGIDWAALAEKYQMSEPEIRRKLKVSCKTLKKVRDTRVRPHRDEKILTGWNALMIAAFATAARAFSNDDYLRVAESGYQFLQDHLYTDGKLKARYIDGEAAIAAFQDDYAALLTALDALYEATFNPEYIKRAKTIADAMIDHFYDDERGGFYIRDKKEKALIARTKEGYDGASPSGNSLAALSLLKLARRTGETDYEKISHETVEAFGEQINHAPTAFGYFLLAPIFHALGGRELVALLPEEEATTPEFDQFIRSFQPEWVALKGTKEGLKEVAAFTSEFKAAGSETTYYLCEGFSCKQPVTDFSALL